MCSPYIQCGGPVRDVRVSIADLLMIKPAPSFCDRGVNTFWIGLLAGAICFRGCLARLHATQVYPGGVKARTACAICYRARGTIYAGNAVLPPLGPRRLQCSVVLGKRHGVIVVLLHFCYTFTSPPCLMPVHVTVVT